MAGKQRSSMAESSKNVMERSVEELEKEITCAICREIYVEPKVLPCCHYYCKKCVYNFASRTGLDQPFSCPECRADTKLPQSSVDCLPTAFFIRRIKDLHSKLKQVQNAKAVGECKMCTSGSCVTAYCQQCMQYICEKCTESHQRMKIFSDHVITELDQTTNEGAMLQEPVSLLCDDHGQTMSLYCFDCSSFICRDCTIKDHFNHNNEFIGKAASQAREKLALDLKPLHDVVAELCNSTEEIRTSRIGVESLNTSIVRRVEDSFHQFQTILEYHKEDLLNEVSCKFRIKLDNLASQEKMVSNSLAAVTRVMEHTEQSIHHFSDTEIILMETEVRDTIHRVIDERGSDAVSLNPVEETNIEVDLCSPQDFTHFFHNKAKLVVLPVDPSKCTVSGVGVKFAEVGEPATFNLATKLSNGNSTMQSSTVSCFLTSALGRVVRCNVRQPKHGQYSIQYAPAVRGKNHLTIKVNEHEVAGSPFSVCVYTPVTGFDKPVSVIKQLSTPHDVAINSRWEIIVAEWVGNIVSFNKEGKRLKSIRKADHKFVHPTGVAVDQDDCIYVTDKTNWIVKFDDDMKLVKKIKHNSSSHLIGVTVSAEKEVLVYEKADNFITVYSTELEYTRRIKAGSATHQGIAAIAADSFGLIYFTHHGSSLIHVLNSAGELLRTFSLSDGIGVCGISVADRYVYVTDEKDHRIVVYSTEGEYLASFGQWGSDNGHFYGPSGLCVKDSFVHVCDRYNNRVQVF